MADEPQPTTKALSPHAAQSSECLRALNKITTNDPTTADMPGESKASHTSERNCPIFKLPTELHLEICRLAFQHTLDLVSPPDKTKSRSPAIQTTRGALALLYTCRTLRAESIHAMEPLAKASKLALQSEIHLARSMYSTIAENMSDTVSNFFAPLTLEFGSHPMQSKMTEIEEACSVLAFAREADEKMSAGVKTGRARDKTTIEIGQWVIWSSA